MRVLPWISWLYFHASVPIADMPNNHEINTSASEVMMTGVFRAERRCTTNRRTKKTKTIKFSVQVIPNIPSAVIGTSSIIEFVKNTANGIVVPWWGEQALVQDEGEKALVRKE